MLVWYKLRINIINMIMAVYSLYCPKMKGQKYESGTITWIEYKIIHQSFIFF